MKVLYCLGGLMSLMLTLWTESSFTDCVLEKDFLSNMSEHLRSYSPMSRSAFFDWARTFASLKTYSCLWRVAHN